MDRRIFLRRAGALGAGLVLGAGRGALRAAAAAPPLGRIAYQLGWVKNFQFAGEYFADARGYYRRFGVEVDLLSGGPTVNIEPAVMSGKALVGQSMPDLLATANAKGASLRIIAACYQRNVSAIISLARTPLVEPRDMIGKRIGVQITNLVIWHAFLRLNGIAQAAVTTVPVQFDLTPLATGEVDGFFGEVIDDAVELRESGVAIHIMPFADFGYHMLTATYEVTTASLADPERRSQLVAFMKGDLLGWRDVLRDPAGAARLTVERYGRQNGLDYRRQEASCIVQNEFIVSPETAQHGLFWMSPQRVDQTLAALDAAGVHARADYFTNEILDEARNQLAAL